MMSCLDIIRRNINGFGLDLYLRYSVIQNLENILREYEMIRGLKKLFNLLRGVEELIFIHKLIKELKV